MDLSKISTEDLIALRAGDLSKVSTSGLQLVKQMAFGDKVAAQTEKDRAEYDPTKDMSTGQRVLAGIGQGMTAAGRGVRDLFSSYTPEQRAEQQAIDAPLQRTTAGKVGNVLGAAAVAAPAMLIPGANTMVGAGLIGAGTSALTTEGNALERFKAGAAGAAGGMAGVGAGKAIGWAANRGTSNAAAAQVANAGKDAAVNAAQDAGYVVTPAMTSQPGIVGTVSEALGGKIKTQQLASVKNTANTNALARVALGMAPDEQITAGALKQIRADAGTAYDVIRSAGTVTPDNQFQAALQGISQKYQGAGQSFPGLVKGNPVQDIVDGLNVPKFDAGDAVDAIKVLRETADKAYGQRDSQLGKAAKSAAGALEDMLDRHATQAKMAPDVVQAFRDARQTIAKTYTVQKALNDSTGDVSARVLGQQIKKGAPLTDELRTAGEFGNAFKMAAQDGVTVPKFSVLDAAMGGAGLGAGNAAAVVVPLLRPGMRSLALSQMVQRQIGNPSYGTSSLTRLDNPLAQLLLRSGGVGGSAYAVQK